MTEFTADKQDVRHGDRTLVVRPILKTQVTMRDSARLLEEAVGLAEAINLAIIDQLVINIAAPTPATLMGKGQVDSLAAIVETSEIQLVVIDFALSPIQQRNLEKKLQCKVIDRTGLILEIFGERARTREGMLQVELAALNYQKSRLVRSWTHLERQRGGFGFLGGPGESQLEMDRRMIDQRILKIKGELKDVRRTRGLQREARQKAERPTVALVGYTNAGKSSLFNRLTGAGVLSKNMLFATLDPTLRGIALPSGREAVLSDTVGFISDLPTQLVEAFRATLEEVMQAEVILHVRDMAHPETRSQKHAVMAVLGELGINADDERIIEVQNKIDLLSADEQNLLTGFASRDTDESHIMPHDLDGVRDDARGGTVAVSALTGNGLDRLISLIDEHIAATSQLRDISIEITDGAALSWLYAHGKVMEKRDTKTKSRLKVLLSDADHGRFMNKFQPTKKGKS